jgi:ABC-type branched-subunit amino acid transport system ATPase component
MNVLDPKIKSGKNSAILEARSITKSFDGVRALSEVNFRIRSDSLTAVIGPNGAGKSTLLNIITGVLKPDSGAILLKGEDITRMRPDRIASQGVGRSFQIVRLFTINTATVMDNVLLGAHRQLKPGVFKSWLRRMEMKRAEEAAREEAKGILKFLNMDHLAGDIADELSLGNQRMVELARALMLKPGLLLLDEPASGLNEAEVSVFADILKTLQSQGISIVLVEHNMDLVMKIAQDIVVLNFGEKVAQGTPAEISQDPLVVSAYLGEDIGEDQYS